MPSLRLRELNPDNTENLSGLGHAYAGAENRAEAEKVIAQMKAMSAKRYVSPYGIVVIYAGLDEKDQAFAFLQKAPDERSYFMAVYLPTDARLDGLRDDARFAELKRSVGLP